MKYQDCRKTLEEFISKRAESMPPFLVMEIMEKAVAMENAGRSVVHLEVGEPDFDTPIVIREAGIRAIQEGKTHYTHSLGHPELREAICQWYFKRYQVSLTPNRIVVTVGSSGAMSLVFAALLNPGSEVLLTDPHYACYPNFVSAFSGIPIRLAVREQDGFQFELKQIEANLRPQTAAVVLNSPANPTGIVTSPRKMQEITEVTAGKAVLISDEIYHGLEYQDQAHSILEYCPDAVVINGFSKLFAMTGWRLGYTILPEKLVRPVQKLQQNLFISAPDFAQVAAIAALTQAGADVENMRCCYDQRRKFLLKRIREMGLKILVEPTGAFYVFVNVSRFTTDVLSFAYQILEEAGVAVTPGVDFGPGGEGFIRLSYANSIENIEEGMRRLEVFFNKLV